MDLTTAALPSLIEPDLVTVQQMTSLKTDTKEDTNTLECNAFDAAILPKPKSNARLSLVNAYKQTLKLAEEHFKNCREEE